MGCEWEKSSYSSYISCVDKYDKYDKTDRHGMMAWPHRPDPCLLLVFLAGVQLTETMRNCSFRPWMHSWSLYSVLGTQCTYSERVFDHVRKQCSQPCPSHVRYRDRHAADDGWKLQMKPRSN